MKNPSLIIYTTESSPRLQYIANVLLHQLLGIDFQIVTDKYYFTSSLLPKINYTNGKLNTLEVNIPNNGLLFNNKIEPQELNFTQVDGLPVLFSSPPYNQSLPFDFFSMAFYLLSRYEEYLPFTPDKHGRFTAQQSVGYIHGFLELPIIEMWLKRLRLTLIDKFPSLHIKLPFFQCIPTYDIDLAWAYLHRPWWRVFGSSLGNCFRGEWNYLKQRLQVFNKKENDPYDVYSYLQEFHEKLNLKPIFFFLLADYHTHDKNISFQNPALQSLIQKLHKQYQIGIHPSYQSNKKSENLPLEIKRLAHITRAKVTHSRQHFLKLHLPQTYQKLIKLGIKHDYSMGYADQIGFRAGISRPYLWYDLSEEKATTLIIHPFCAMDVTLQQYLQLTPDAAIEKLNSMIENLANTGGVFSTLWHNSSFSKLHGWAGWKIAYEHIIYNAVKRISK